MRLDAAATGQPAANPTTPTPSSPQRRSPHLAPLLILLGLSVACWSKVLFTGQVLLPGAFLRGFAPFGADPHAPWTILYWDALGQYYPWRTFAARQLHEGLIPLWNPHQFAGTPFLANAQSAVLYPLSLPFWLMDTACAFGVSAFLHTLLAAFGTYFLAQRWGLSRAASVLAAIVFAFCGYLGAWIVLPTLANTASWLPLLLLLLERAAAPATARLRAIGLFALALCCTLLAGHPQIFIYILLALGLRACLLPLPGRSLGVLGLSCFWTVLLAAAQILPTLELAQRGHRASAGTATALGWQTVVQSAVQPGDLLSLIVPAWPMSAGTINENFGYLGFGAVLLATIGIAATVMALRNPSNPSTPRRQFLFAAAIALFALAYATATPLTKLVFYNVPGMAQFVGVGRMLLLWSLGAALLAAFGLDFLRRRWKTPVLPVAACGLVAIELFAAGGALQPTAPRDTIYPPTQLTTWLQENTRDKSRVLFLTPRGGWLPTELFSGSDVQRTHPPGILPPNGPTVYGLYDVNGYDSLAAGGYRGLLIPAEGADVSPPLNGNMILLNNPDSTALDSLNVRYIVAQNQIAVRGGRQVLKADGCYVYDIAGRSKNVEQKNGSDFYPGWKQEKYQPETFRCGLFLSLVALAMVVGCWTGKRRKGTT